MPSDRSNLPEASFDARCPSRWWVPGAIACSIFLASGYPFILSGFVKGRGAHDQLNYHEQVIRRFAQQWPHLDYSDYLSATTPGYHTLLALAARMGLESRIGLQLLGSLLTLGFLMVLAWSVRPLLRRMPCADGLLLGTALLMPVIASMAVWYSGVWLLPDNVGWLGVLGVWLVALSGRFDWKMLLTAAAMLAALVFLRQIHIWTLSMLLTAAWLGVDRRACAHNSGSDVPHGTTGPTLCGPEVDVAKIWQLFTTSIVDRLGRVGLVLVASLPAAALLGYFVWLWNGLTPPVLKQRQVGINWAAPVFVLAVFGYCSVFFVPFVWDGLKLVWHRHRWLLMVVVAGSLLVGLVPATGYDEAAGRYSGLWSMAGHLPMVGHSSVLIVGLGLLGSVLLTGWFASLDWRDRWIMLAGFVGFTATQCVSVKLWQRYTEPMVLLWLVLAASRVRPALSGPMTGPMLSWRVIGPVLLAMVLGMQTAMSLVMAHPVKVRELVAPWEETPPRLPGMIERQ